MLDRFFLLEDVGVYQTQAVTEHSGKTSSKTQISWNYTEDGEVSWEKPYNNDRLYYNTLVDYDIQKEYDADGRLAKALYFVSGDNAGNVAQEQKNATVTIETVYGNYYFYK